MNKARVLALARQRQVKKVDGTPSEGDSTHLAEGSLGKPKDVSATGAQQSTLPPKPQAKKRVLTLGDKAGSKKHKSSGEDVGFRLEDEGSDSEVRELQAFPPKGSLKAPQDLAGGSSSVPVNEGVGPTGGLAGDTILRLGPGQGWLGDDPEKVPLGALSFFSLPSDKALIEMSGDEEVLCRAKEAFGRFGSYFMEVAERVMINRHRATTEYNKALLEKSAKLEAWKETKEVKCNLDVATQALKREKEGHAASTEKLTKVEDELSVEKGMCASLRGEVEKLKKVLVEKEAELSKVTDTLERVEQNADIVYEDCVKRYKASAEFLEEIELKAGVFHEEGWKDCLGFIGTGNAANPEVHTIESFRDVELAKYEQALGETDKQVEAEVSKDGAMNAGGKEAVP